MLALGSALWLSWGLGHFHAAPLNCFPLHLLFLPSSILPLCQPLHVGPGLVSRVTLPSIPLGLSVCGGVALCVLCMIAAPQRSGLRHTKRPMQMCAAAERLQQLLCNAGSCSADFICVSIPCFGYQIVEPSRQQRGSEGSPAP